MVAKTRDWSPIRVVEYLAEEGADAHIKALQILEPNKVAQEAWRKFAQAFIEFHIALNRYRLAELFPTV